MSQGGSNEGKGERRDQRMGSGTSCSARFMVRVMFHTDCVGRRQVLARKEREETNRDRGE